MMAVWIAAQDRLGEDIHHGVWMDRIDQSAPTRVEPQTPEHDEQLVMARLAAGDLSALEALYDRHARVTLAVALRIVNDRQTAEDVLQEAMVRVWQHAAKYDGSLGGVRPWLLSITHNLALNELRRRRRHPQDVASSEPWDESWAASIPDAAADPAEDAWRNARQATLSAALAKLPEMQAEIIALYAVGHSQSDIAARLDQPLGTVKTRMRRGLLQLREILGRDGHDLK